MEVHLVFIETTATRTTTKKGFNGIFEVARHLTPWGVVFDQESLKNHWTTHGLP